MENIPNIRIIDYWLDLESNYYITILEKDGIFYYSETKKLEETDGQKD